jgi:hypothetical protein
MSSQRYQEFIAERTRLLERIKELEAENAELRKRLGPQPPMLCPNRQFSPLTYNDYYRHLEGKDSDGRDVIGLYVLNEDNTCQLLCTDFA